MPRRNDSVTDGTLKRTDMNLVKFEIEKAKSGKYRIVTREGLPVRIICWDALCTDCSCNMPIIGLVKITKPNDGFENAYKYERCVEYSVRGKADDERVGAGYVPTNNKTEDDLFLTKDKYDGNIVIVSEWDEPNQQEDYLWEKHYEPDETDKRVESEMKILRKHVKKHSISEQLRVVMREVGLRVLDEEDYYKRLGDISERLEDMFNIYADRF